MPCQDLSQGRAAFEALVLGLLASKVSGSMYDVVASRLPTPAVRVSPLDVNLAWST